MIPFQSDESTNANGKATPKGGISTQQPFPFLKIERRPLLSLFAAGKVAPVDAAALGCLPNEFVTRSGLSRDDVINRWYDNLPTFGRIMDTS